MTLRLQRSHLLWTGSLLVLLFAVAVAFNLDMEQIGTALRQADWRLVAVASCLNVALLYFRVLKWRFVFDPAGFPGFYNLSLAAFAAYACNNVIPARIGIIVQVWLLGEKENRSKSTVFGTLVLVRIIDIASLSVIGLLVFQLMEVPANDQYWGYVRHTGSIVISLLFAGMLAAALLQRQQWLRTRLAGFTAAVVARTFKDRFSGSLQRFRQGFSLLERPRYLLLVVLLNFLFWLLCGLSIYLHLKAFSIEPITLLTPLYVLLVQAVSFAIPAPAHFGPFHIATIAALSLLGVTPEVALSVAIVIHANVLVTNTLPGLIYLGRENIRLAALDIRAP